MSDGLPKGWATAPLREIAEARMGETILAKQLTPTGVPVFSAGQENTPWGLLENPRKPHGKGTVVVSARGSIGFPKIPKAERFASTQTTIALRFPDEEFAAYGCLWLKTVDWAALTKGGAIPMLTVGDINELLVPLAPPAEQRRIVAKLETLLGKVDASQQRLAKIPVLLKRFRQSVLAAACSGRLTADWRDDQPAALPISIRSSLTEEISTPDLPETWLVAALDDCCNRIIDGNYGADYPKKDEFVPSGIPFLTSAAIGEDGNIIETEIRFIAPSKHAVLKKAQTTLGDVVFTNRGARVGATAMLLDSRFAVSNIGPQVTRLASNPAVLLPKYLFLWMRTSFFTSTMKERNGGSAMNFLNLTVTKALPIFLPPLPEQQEIVRRVEGLFALADKLEARLAKARGQVDKLTPSLLARAFAGQLVPQNPADEPAERLLEQISKKVK